MNLAYFRKSKRSVEETIKELKKAAQTEKWDILGEIDLKKTGKMVVLCKPEWVESLSQTEHQLLGFLPCSVTVLQKGENVLVGSGEATILKAVSQNQQLNELAVEIETAIKLLIHKAGDVQELKPTKVKLYSTTTCPYCTMEKSWLDSKKVEYDQIMVDLNQEEAENLVKKTGQMGVPVTEIQYEDADPEYIIGFDKNRLATILNVTT